MVFDAPVSAGVMERDFCISDMCVTRKRGGLDPTTLKMVLHLRQQFPYIPQDIPKLSDKEVARVISDPLKDLLMHQKVQVLDYNLEDDREGGADAKDLSWVDEKGTRDSGGAAVGGESSDSPLEE